MQKGITSPEQSEKQSADFRAGCDYRRNGKVIERRDGDGWAPVKTHPSINAAKFAAREYTPGTLYAEG